MENKRLDAGFKHNLLIISLVATIAVGLSAGFIWFNSKGREAPAASQIQINTHPDNAVPVTTENPRYSEILRKNNDQGAEAALKTGTSFVPVFPDRQDIAADKIDAPLSRVRSPALLPAQYVPQREDLRRSDAFSNQQWSIALLNDWTPPEVEVSESKAARPQLGSKAGSRDASSNATHEVSPLTNAKTGPTVAKTGDIAAAYLIGPIDTDRPSKVLAKVGAGPLANAELIGEATRANEVVNVKFTRMSFMAKTYEVDAQAVDVNYSTAMEGDVNHKYLTRFGIPILVAMLTGYGQVLQNSANTVTVNPFGGTTTQSNPNPGNRQIIGAAVGQGAQAIGSQIASQAFQAAAQPQVIIPAETPIGILFLADVIEK